MTGTYINGKSRRNKKCAYLGSLMEVTRSTKTRHSHQNIKGTVNISLFRKRSEQPKSQRTLGHFTKNHKH